MPTLLRYSICLLLTAVIFSAGYLLGQKNQRSEPVCHHAIDLLNDAVRPEQDTVAEESFQRRPALLM